MHPKQLRDLMFEHVCDSNFNLIFVAVSGPLHMRGRFTTSCTGGRWMKLLCLLT